MAGWGGIRVAGFSLPKLQHTSKQEHATTEKSQAPDDVCINVRNMLSIEEVK